MLCKRLLPGFLPLPLMNHDSSDKGQYPTPDTPESNVFAPPPALPFTPPASIHFGRSRDNGSQWLLPLPVIFGILTIISFARDSEDEK